MLRNHTYWIGIPGLLLCLFQGCAEKDLRFESQTVLHAPKSDLKVEVTCEGTVPAGHDQGHGIARVNLSSPQGKFDTLHFTVTEYPSVRDMVYQDSVIVIEDSTQLKKNLLVFLNDVGFENYHEDELDVLETLIIGTCYGPKGTALNGTHKGILITQTKVVSSRGNGDTIVYE